MEAIFRLAWLRDDGLLMPVNWRDMETEELGSVYESLLELTPRLSLDGREFTFAEGAQTKGNARKTSGSYYTPDSLVQVLLNSALDPVLNRIESESEDPVRALLAVTVIDPACGSGHFLLAAARRIARRVVRLRHGDIHTEQQRLAALRDVVRSCIHGVDRNPMAVELTKVALWIETVEPGKPLGFLDGNIRVGDSLLGIFDLDALRKSVPDAAYKPLTGDDKVVARDFAKKNKDEIKGQTRMRLTAAGETPALPKLAQSIRAVRQLPENTVAEIEAKRVRFESAAHDPKLQNLAQAADLYIAGFLTPKTPETAREVGNSLIPTTADVQTAMSAGTVYGPRLGASRQLASDARAFHWPLEFPDIMAAGGFDAVLGNPPWEVMQLGEEEYFAQRMPEIAELAGAERKRQIAALERNNPTAFRAFQVEKRRFEAGNEFARCSGRFDLTARGKVNTYSLFAEHFTRLASPRGRAGIIVPTGIATDASTAPFFGWLIEKRKLAQLIDFENRDAIFPAVHRSYKFSLMTTGHNMPEAQFAFFLTDVAQLADAERRFALSPEQIALINPNTKTAPVFRSRFDAQLTAKIYSRVPVLIDLGRGAEGNPWEIEFRQGLFNMTSDSGLFVKAEQFDAMDGAQRDGVGWVVSGNPELDDSVGRYLPLYEAKMIHHYDHRWATYDGLDSRDTTSTEHRDLNFEVMPRYWVHERLVHERLAEKNWNHQWLMGWRDICRATDERTLIATAFPAVAVGNNLPIMLSSADTASNLFAAFIGSLSSLVTDYGARLKAGGTHLNFFIYEQLAVLPASAYDDEGLTFLCPRVLELIYTSRSMTPFARDLGYDGDPFPWNEDRRALLRAELDAWYARAYGLTRDELRFVLDPSEVLGPEYPSETFRVLKEKELKLYEKYRTQRLVLDAWDRMERGELHCPAPYDKRKEPATAAQSLTLVQRDVSGKNPLLGAGPLFEGIESTPVERPRFVDPSTLPNGAWAMPNYNSISVQIQLAAILKQLSGPTSAAQVRLTALYALNPRLLTSRLSGTDLKHWQRLVGDSAPISGAANMIQFTPRVNIEWRDAYTQLRGMHALLEDATNGTWAPGSSVQDFMTEGWADGRAGFVMKAMEGMEIEKSIAQLPVDLQAWVKAHAA
jgi:hypothetical protein